MPVTDPDAVGLLRSYFVDVASSYYRRPATDAEVDAALADEPSDDLTPPTGLFLAARQGVALAGCVGFRVISADVTELTRMFIHPDFRGHGGGGALIVAAENAARDGGARTMRLDTRSDLLEARGLYTKHGYGEVPAYGESLYSDRWFTKALD